LRSEFVAIPKRKMPAADAIDQTENEAKSCFLRLLIEIFKK